MAFDGSVPYLREAMRLFRALLLPCLVVGCGPSFSVRERSLGTLAVRDWTIEVVGYESRERRMSSHDFQNYTHWSVYPSLYVSARGEGRRDLGSIFAASEVDTNAHIRPLFEGLKLVGCSLPDGRTAFRLEGAPAGAPFHPSPAWWIAYAMPSTFAIARDQSSAAHCEDAVATALPVDAWARMEIVTPRKPLDVMDPVINVTLLAVKGTPLERRAEGGAWALAVREGLASDAVLSDAVFNPTVALDAAADGLPDDPLGKIAKLDAERKRLFDWIAGGGLGESSPGLAMLRLITPSPGAPPFAVTHHDSLRMEFDRHVRWVVEMALHVPAGEARDKALQAILEGCERPESRASCSPFSTWVVATLAREKGDAALCDRVLGLVPTLVGAKVSVLEWTALGALRGVGECGTASLRNAAAASALTPEMPLVSGEPRDPIEVPSHEELDTSAYDCHAGLDPLAIHDCRSLPGWARVVLQASCVPKGLEAARKALKIPSSERVIREEASCIIARCAPKELDPSMKMAPDVFERHCALR